MRSIILYDTRNNEIKRCQPKPHGSAGLPSFDALCRSARIPDGEKQYMGTIIIDGEYLTYQAQEELRIIEITEEVEDEYPIETVDENGNPITTTEIKLVEKNIPKAIKKPELLLSVDKTKIDLAIESTITLTVEIINTLEGETFDIVTLMLDDIEFQVTLTDNQGAQQIEFMEPDKYIISCTDDRFISSSVTIEVV